MGVGPQGKQTPRPHSHIHIGSVGAWRLRPGSCRQSPNTRVTKFVTVFQYTTGAVLALME